MILHTYEWGDPDAPPLICLHGVTGHGERYKRLAEEHWAKRFRVIAPDLRGHGRSGWEPPWTYPTHVADLVETADALGIGEADWVGHSFGGRLVLELAAAHPERVRRAVLLDPAIQALPHIALQNAEHQLSDPVYVSAEDYAERRGDGPSTPRALVLEDAELHCDRLADGRLRRRTCQPAMVSIYGEIPTDPPPPETLRMPALLVYAPAFGLVTEEQLAAYADRAEIVEVPGMHMVMWDAFDEVAAAVDRFLT
ncbi:MAG TPA: alpha/beta hydrolase [Gaiellaceae bacterium]|nr:alpha/beta hydrolase [Gaiellaceae bacterium]